MTTYRTASSKLWVFLFCAPLASCGSTGTAGDTESGGFGASANAGGAGGAHNAGGSGGFGDAGGGGFGGAGNGGNGNGGGPGLHPVTFSYTPWWTGVESVVVVGGFGQPDDWSSKTPLLELKDDGSGTWSGSTMLAPGSYRYMFRVVGDNSGPPGYSRYALDVSMPITQGCPETSPTYNENHSNPCSQVTVPQTVAQQPVYKITGTVEYGGAPVADYIVRLDNYETGLAPYFVNRATTGADGKFTLLAPPGKFRLQVQHPTYLSVSDKDRDPFMYFALRRSYTTVITVTDDIALSPAEMEYADYDKLSPTSPTATLPTTFEMTLPPNVLAVRAAVFGTSNGMGKNVGAEWYTSPYGTDTTATFDGVFNTKDAQENSVVAGEQYYWGIVLYRGAGNGHTWRGQSMVLPITWQ